MQRRFFKLTTRETLNPDKPYLYNLMWYKKEGGSVLKALDADKIASLTVCHSPRPLAYSPYKLSLSLSSEVKYQLGVVDVVPTEKEEGGATLSVVPGGSEFITFTVVQTDGKEHVLRSGKVDRVIKWINTLAMVSRLTRSCEILFDDMLLLLIGLTAGLQRAHPELDARCARRGQGAPEGDRRPDGRPATPLWQS